HPQVGFTMMLVTVSPLDAGVKPPCASRLSPRGIDPLHTSRRRGRSAVYPEMNAVRELEAPLKQSQKASELLTRYQTAVTQLSRIRREAIEQLIAQGMTKAQLAEHLGMTRARVGPLLAAGTRSAVLCLGYRTRPV